MVLFELLRRRMVVGPAQIFVRYHEKDVTPIWRRKQFDKEHHRAWCKFVISLLLRWCKCPVIKTRWLWMRSQFDQMRIERLSKGVLKGKAFRFSQVFTEVLYGKFSGIAVLIVVQEIYVCNVTEEIEIFKEKNRIKTKRSQKVLSKRTSAHVCNIVWGLQRFINWLTMNKVSIFMFYRRNVKCEVWCWKKSLGKYLGDVAKLKRRGVNFMGKW